MVEPAIHGNPRTLTASLVLSTIGNALGEIRHRGGLTWAEIGGVLRRSEDQAAKYADGSAEMGIVAFAHAKQQWGSLFTGPLNRLCIETSPLVLCDHAAHSAVLRGALSMAEALESNDDISPREVMLHRHTLEAARDALDAMLRKACP